MLRAAKRILLVILFFSGLQAYSQLPVITARFANPEYDFATQTYTLDIELHSDTPNKKLYMFTIRFFYDDNILEFNSFGEFLPNYGIDPFSPLTVTTSNPSGGTELFGFSGPFDVLNGNIKQLASTPIYISNTGWMKYFNVSFHVDDPNAPLTDNFCPSVVWDLEEDPANGGFLIGSAGVVILLGNQYSYQQSTENVIQYNWDYDSIPDPPYGYPENITCLSTRVAPRISIDSTMAQPNEYVTFALPVRHFTAISAVSLTLDYNTSALEYCCAIPHAAIDYNFAASLAYAGRLQLSSNGITAAVPYEESLVDVTFKYLGGSADLTWYDNGSSCQYTNSNTGLSMYDSPTASFYTNGAIATGEYNWTGITSTNWDTRTNWENNFLPGRFSHVTISSTPMPPHWPTYNGDFSLGSQCGNITLEGASQLTVTGSLSIEPGHLFDITGNGTVNVGNDWINSGAFNPGMGSVVFLCSGDGAILEGSDPEEYVTGYTFSTFTPGMTPLSGGSSGPGGDNAHVDAAIGFPFSYLGTEYTQVRINTNGWMSLNLSGSDATSPKNILLFNSCTPSTVLAPWWDDLNADGASTISYLTSGTSPNRVFTAEWKNILAYSSGATARLNFQVRLYESSNIIEFCYGTVVAGTHNASEGASIGIKDCTGGPGNFVETAYGTSYLSIACLRSETQWPAANYRFIPPIASTTETFHHITVTGDLRVERNVTVTGLD